MVKVRNEEVLRMKNKDRQLSNTSKMRKTAYFGHNNMRNDKYNFLQLIIEDRREIERMDNGLYNIQSLIHTNWSESQIKKKKQFFNFKFHKNIDE